MPTDREADRFSRYGADTGEYAPARLNQIRFTTALSCLADKLAGYAAFGAVFEDGQPVYARPKTFTAEQAIADFRELEQTLTDVSDLALRLPPSDTLNQIQVILCQIDLQQADWPAEAAMLDGDNEQPVVIIQEAVEEVYDQVWRDLKRVTAEYSVNEVWSKGSGSGPGDTAKPRKRKRLPTRSAFIYEKLFSLESHKAMKFSDIQKWYETEAERPDGVSENLDEGTWKRIRKELEPWGLQHRPNVGFYIEK